MCTMYLGRLPIYLHFHGSFILPSVVCVHLMCRGSGYDWGQFRNQWKVQSGNPRSVSLCLCIRFKYLPFTQRVWKKKHSKSWLLPAGRKARAKVKLRNNSDLLYYTHATRVAPSEQSVVGSDQPRTTRLFGCLMWNLRQGTLWHNW